MADRAPVVIYAAKSTEDRKGSIPTQIAECREAVEREGDRTIVGEFSDEGKSAFSGNRGDGLAAAKLRATEAANEHGEAELWVAHTDRLARGDGVAADHLGEIFFAMRKASVRLRSVRDDSNCEDAIRAVLIGERNTEDSKGKSKAIRAGLRRAADRGEMRSPVLLDGYAAQREVDDHGRVTRTIIKDPERAHIFELLWELARAGKSLQAIQLEFSSRGFVTAPRRRDYRARPFDCNRLSQALENPTYAGIVVYRGETLATTGNWPRYVEPEDFYRLREERRARSNATKRSVGRPAVGYLLAQLATCGECGTPVHTDTGRQSKARRYLCRAHRDHHRDSAEWCPALPYDAIEADRIVLAGIDRLLSDADALGDQLLAGRRAETENLTRTAQSARDDATAAERVAEKAEQRWAKALEDDDEAAAEIALATAKRKRIEATNANTRLAATLDAISNVAAEEPDAGHVMAKIWAGLNGRVAEAKGDIRKLNAALREHFQRMELHRAASGELSVVPVLSADAVVRILHEPNRSPFQVRDLDTDATPTVDSTALAFEVPLLTNDRDFSATTREAPGAGRGCRRGDRSPVESSDRL